MKLTRQEAIELFREHWRGLAETGRQDKNEFTRRKGHWRVFNDCYLCQYVLEKMNWPLGENVDPLACEEYCPIKWPVLNDNKSPCLCHNSFYEIWIYADSSVRRKHLAEIISELPERPESRPVPVTGIQDVSDIDTSTPQGKLLLVTLARLTVCAEYAAKKPDEVLKELIDDCNIIWK